MHLRRGFFALAFVCVFFACLGVAPVQRAISYSELMPLAHWQKEFQIIEGKDRGRVVPFFLQRDAADEKSWSLTVITSKLSTAWRWNTTATCR